MKTYELLTIFKPNLDAEEVDKLIAKSDNILRTMFMETAAKASV